MDARRKLQAKRKLVSCGRSGRVEERFRASVEKGNYYEAHQTLRALYQRYIAQGKDQNAWNFLRQGCLLLIKKDQWESGTEVSIMLVNHLKERHTKVTDEIIGYLEEIFKSYNFFKDDDFVTHPRVLSMRTCPSVASLTNEDRGRLNVMQTNREIYMKAALKWSSLDDDFKHGHPRLYGLLAIAYFEESEFEKSRQYFLYANMPEEFGLMLIEFATQKGHSSEADMFITQAVLQLLVLQNKDVAFATFLQYCGRHPVFKSIMPPPFEELPLLNFAWHLILSIDIGDFEVYSCLCNLYSPVLRRDYSYFDYLQKIGSTFFGAKMPKKQSESNGLLQMLMGEGGGEGLNNLMSSMSNMLGLSEGLPPEFQGLESVEGLD